MLPVVHVADGFPVEEDPQRNIRELGMFGTDHVDERADPAIGVVGVGVANEQINLIRREPRQAEDAQHGRTDRLTVAAAASADVRLAQPAIRRVGHDAPCRVAKQFRVEQLDGVVRVGPGALREVDVAEVIASFRGDPKIAALDQTELLANLAHAACAKRFIVELVSADEVEGAPAVVSHHALHVADDRMARHRLVVRLALLTRPLGLFVHVAGIVRRRPRPPA